MNETYAKTRAYTRAYELTYAYTDARMKVLKIDRSNVIKSLL